MGKIKKTNAMRILDGKKLDYTSYSYQAGENNLDGISVARELNKDLEEVYKTLVCVGASREHYVFIIPVGEELDLKKAAKSVGEKSVAMIRLADLKKLTGYVRGGCSPIGMRSKFKTVIDISARDRSEIIVSGGKIGVQLGVKPSYIEKLTASTYSDLLG